MLPLTAIPLISLGLAVGLALPAYASGEIRATAALAMARDPSGQKAAATAAALLEQRVRAAPKLRLLEPARVLSGDPRTREEETLERARAALADGRRAYDALTLDDAIARLGQAVSLYQQTGPLLGDLDELATALAYLGAALVLRGSADEGQSTFLELLTISPNFQLDDFPPAVKRIFDRALRRVDRAATGSVEIYSTPPYAAVFVDGRYEGVTPLILEDLLAGTHYLRLEKLGYKVHGAPLEVAPNQRITNQTRLRNVRRGVRLRDLAARSAFEVTQKGMGGALRSIARTLVADTVIFVSVTQSGRDATFVGGVFDGRSSVRLATKRIVLGVSQPTFLRDLRRYLDKLVAAAESESAGRQTSRDLPTEPEATDGAFGLSGTGDSSGEDDAAPPPAVAAPPRSSDDPSDRAYVSSASKKKRVGRIAGWTVAGVGAATVIAGAVFGGLALDTHNDFRSTAQNSPDLNDLQDRGKQNALIADVLYGVGGVMLAGGLITVILIETAGPSTGELFEVRQAGLTPTDGGAVVSLGGAF